MGLNTSNGNMYAFVSHTMNFIKGFCNHGCIYCYVTRWKNLKPIRFDEDELKTDLGKGNFIFVGSSNDMFAEGVNEEWILKSLNHCKKYDNKYLFQSKNPANFVKYIKDLPPQSVICTTIETNRYYPEIMSNSPTPEQRAMDMSKIEMIDKYVTIEPILDFDLEELVALIKLCSPVQVNIGGVTGGHKLPSPPKEKIFKLISELDNFTNVVIKKNLHKLLK